MNLKIFRNVLCLTLGLITAIHGTAPEPLCYFAPPIGWEITDPTTLSQSVQISFFKKQQGYCPSINLAIEKTDASQSEYLDAVKSIHKRDRTKCWRLLGKVDTAAGTAQLTEIDMSTKWGPARLLQMILVKDGYAYILTASALKKETARYYKEFQDAFSSLHITKHLIGEITDLEKRTSLELKKEQFLSIWKEKSKPDQEKEWISFRNFVLENFSDMGAYWQILFLKSIYLKMENPNEKNTYFLPDDHSDALKPSLTCERSADNNGADNFD